MIIVLILSMLACQTLTKGLMPGPSSAGPPTASGEGTLSMDWLITADELNSISADIGILNWQLVEDTPGQNRICRTFRGTSWSAVPNEGLNCIFKIAAGASFQSIVDGMINDNQLMADSQPVQSSLSLDGEFELYAGSYPSGHSVFDLILVKDDLMYWSSVTLGTAGGESPQDTYDVASQVIDAFLSNVISKNMEKLK